jgi:hypothetical protein
VGCQLNAPFSASRLQLNAPCSASRLQLNAPFSASRLQLNAPFSASRLLNQVILTIVFLGIGSGLGYFTAGANASTFFAFQSVLRWLEVMYAVAIAVFLA